MFSATHHVRSFTTIIKYLLPALALACVLMVLSAPAHATGPVTITSGLPEGGATNERQVSFRLSLVTGYNSNVDFFCSMDKVGVFQQCQADRVPTCSANGATKLCTLATREFPTAAERKYVFRAFGSECNAPCNPTTSGLDGPILVRNFSVDRTAPVISLTSGPSYERAVTKGNPIFTFSANEPVSYTCSIDEGPALFCPSPSEFDDIGNGRHTLVVKAVDRALNASESLQANFKVDRFKPKRCRRGKSAKAKTKHRKCVKANAKAKARWKKRNRLK